MWKSCLKHSYPICSLKNKRVSFDHGLHVSPGDLQSCRAAQQLKCSVTSICSSPTLQTALRPVTAAQVGGVAGWGDASMATRGIERRVEKTCSCPGRAGAFLWNAENTVRVENWRVRRAQHYNNLRKESDSVRTFSITLTHWVFSSVQHEIKNSLLRVPNEEALFKKQISLRTGLPSERCYT